MTFQLKIGGKTFLKLLQVMYHGTVAERDDHSYILWYGIPIGTRVRTYVQVYVLEYYSSTMVPWYQNGTEYHLYHWYTCTMVVLEYHIPVW